MITRAQKTQNLHKVMASGGGPKCFRRSDSWDFPPHFVAPLGHFSSSFHPHSPHPWLEQTVIMITVWQYRSEKKTMFSPSESLCLSVSSYLIGTRR